MELILTDLIWQACLILKGQNDLIVDIDKDSIVIEKPKNLSFGDFSCGLAFKLSAKNKKSPLDIANIIQQVLVAKITEYQNYISQISVSKPGYINFTVSQGYLLSILDEILNDGDNFGRSKYKDKFLIEYVSANPTGPMHIGHARNAVFGSCLSNLLKFAGFYVEEEFYINDTGQQIIKLGKSLLVCYRRECGNLDYNYDEDSYPESLLIDTVRQILHDHKNSLSNLTDDQLSVSLAKLFMELTINSQKEELEQLNINFNTWFSEKTLHDNGSIDEMLDLLKANNMTYELDGALWLKSKDLGDERDRVLIKNNGHLTYLAVDAAYHLNKYKRGFDKIINIWGADHHGQIPSLAAVLKALDCNVDSFKVILTQMVNLTKNGEILRMSKRMGTVVTLKEVLDEVGSDAMRYFLIESSPSNSINFDLELAKQASSENPIFYIQYAHARSSSIMRKAMSLSPSYNLLNSSVKEIYAICKSNKDIIENVFENDNEKYNLQKKIILELAYFKTLVQESANSYLPHRIAHFAYELAYDFQKFYENSKVLYFDNINLSLARILFVLAIRTVIGNCLKILGISAPEKM